MGYKSLKSFKTIIIKLSFNNKSKGITIQSKQTEVSDAERHPVKQVWPVIIRLIQGAYEYPMFWLSMNMIVVSNIMWPGEPIHIDKITLLYGTCYIIGAFSKLFFGMLADRYSRIKLLALCQFGSSLGFLLYGFTPSGLGMVSFNFMFGVTLFRESFTGESPVIMSYYDDAIDEDKRSHVLASVGMITQVLSLVTLLICTSVFSRYWMNYFHIVGICGITVAFIILVKGKEPKRAAKRKELKNILKFSDITYDHKLNKETFRSTILSPTNIIILIEGVFTQMILVAPQLLIVSYLESAPYNLSPFLFGMMAVIFGTTGAVVTNFGFAKLSDKLANKNIKNRIFIIFTCLCSFYFIWILVFQIQFTPMSVDDGGNFGIFISKPTYLLLCFMYMAGIIFSNLFAINQQPVLQKVNLPEAQGFISSINIFFEILAVGIGSILSGTILTSLGNDYQVAMLVLMLIGMVGAILWLIILRNIRKDIDRVGSILENRVKEIDTNNKKDIKN